MLVKGEHSLWNTDWQFLQWLNIELSYIQGTPLLGMYPREMKTDIHTKTSIQMFIEALFIIAPKQKELKSLPTDEWISKMWYIETIEQYLAVKSNEALSNMDGPRNYHTK